MKSYDFTLLSSLEFELLSRDILQKKYDVFIESFPEGRDRGIDLRFVDSAGNLNVIQCKRYKHYKDLIKKLKEEVDKVKQVNPVQYYIVTSVDLSIEQKDTIKSMFSPFIKSDEHIIGRSDLNNLLSLHPEVELAYVKLWVSSIDILKKIINGRVYHQSKFEIDEINNSIKKFVSSEVFYKSIDIIEKHKFITIAGIPGIGKTTLARMLIYYFLANGYDELICASDIDSVWNDIHESKKQIFYFNDFLGKVTLETNNRYGMGDGSAFYNFIKYISKQTNKILILTTREHLLHRFRQNVESIYYPYESSKILLKIEEYDLLMRGKILYNQLINSSIEHEVVIDVYKSKYYLQVINNENYSPRLLEIVVDERDWKGATLEDLKSRFNAALSNPAIVWEFAFNKQLNSLSRCILIHMAIWGEIILLSDLQKIVENHIKEHRSLFLNGYDSELFNNSLKELTTSFIMSINDDFGNIALDFRNPSILDFLFKYLLDNENIIRDYINAPLYINQLISNITLMKNSDGDYIGSDIHYSYIAQLFSKNHPHLTHIMLYRNETYDEEANFIWSYYPCTRLLLIEYSIDSFLLNHPVCIKYKKVLIKEFQSYIDNFSKEFNQIDLLGFIKVFKSLKSFVKYDEFLIVDVIGRNIILLSNFLQFFSLKDHFPLAFQKFMGDKEKFDGSFKLAYQNQYIKAKDKIGSKELTLLMLKIVQNYLGEDISKRYPFILNDFTQYQIDNSENSLALPETKIEMEKKDKIDRRERETIMVEEYFTDVLLLDS